MSRGSAWVWTVCALALGGAAQLGAGRASAQSCESDTDCSPGLICKSYGVETCATPAIDCAEGEDCPEPAPCDPVEIKQCVLPSCESDDDCPSGTVCHSYTYQQCSGGGDREPAPACAEGEECPQPEEPPACEDPECKDESVTCEEVASEAVCTPVWQLPCTESADCGEGFTCEELISEWCSGSSGSAPSSGGGSDGDPGAGAEPAPEPTPPECGSEPTGEFYCVMTVTACSSDDDCAEGWTCNDNPSRPVCGGASERPASDGDSAGSGDFAPPPEDQPAPDNGCPESTEPEKVCLPPYHDAGSVGVARDGVAETASGGVAGSDHDSGEEPPPRADGEAGEDDDAESDSGMAESESSSCAVAAPGVDARSGLSLFGLLGLSAVLLRRRARKA